MNKRKLYWILQIGGWLTFALVQIVGYIMLGSKPFDLYQVYFWLFEAAIFLLFTQLFRWFIIKKEWLVSSMAALIPRVFVSVIFLGFMVYFTRVLISIPLGIYRAEEAWEPSNIIGLTLVYVLVLFLWSMLYFLYHYFERYNLSLKHAAVLHEIELNNLKSQLNPHFIFNALNSIRALVDENPRKAKSAINQLSGILRNSLVTDKKRLARLEDELQVVKDYLGLEKIRFEERLTVFFDIDPEARRFLVPPLMIQTLVENSIKHGISKLKAGGTVTIKAYMAEKQLIIHLENTGQYKPQEGQKKEAGLGLKNTKQRLSLLYGEEARVEVSNHNEKTVLTKLIIPQNNEL